MKIDAPDMRHVPALRVLWQAVFGDDDTFLDDFFAAAFAPERCRCVMEGDTPAAMLYWFDCTWRGERIAYLYAVATAPSHRRRGLCSALLADTHRHLQALGYAGVVLVPCSEALFAFYEKAGYRLCSRIGELRCRAAEIPAAIREIGADEYAALRRKLLPDGILQEGANLRFLQTQASLYAGDGFLLAASREGDALVGTELLGDTAAAPAIVRALGCTVGRFHIPGGERPFAMYRPLGDRTIPPPAYFGLAFD